MVAHELATLNETREENIALKKTCEGLRVDNEVLTDNNEQLTIVATGNALALKHLHAAITKVGGQELVDAIGKAALKINNAPRKSGKQNKRNRPTQVVTQ